MISPAYSCPVHDARLAAEAARYANPPRLRARARAGYRAGVAATLEIPGDDEFALAAATREFGLQLVHPFSGAPVAAPLPPLHARPRYYRADAHPALARRFMTHCEG